MASLASDGSNRWRIQIGDSSGKRSFQGTQVQAELIRNRVANLAQKAAQ